MIKLRLCTCAVLGIASLSESFSIIPSFVGPSVAPAERRSLILGAIRDLDDFGPGPLEGGCHETLASAKQAAVNARSGQAEAQGATEKNNHDDRSADMSSKPEDWVEHVIKEFSDLKDTLLRDQVGDVHDLLW